MAEVAVEAGAPKADELGGRQHESEQLHTLHADIAILAIDIANEIQFCQVLLLTQPPAEVR